MEVNLEVNPWKSIWFQPRKTIRSIVAFHPYYRLFILACIYGLSSLLSLAQTYSFGLLLKLPILLILILICSPLWGYILFTVFSGVVYLAGKWLGGKAPFLHLITAIAWSSVPMIVSLFLWGILLFLFAGDLFRGFPGSYIFEGYQYSTLFGILLLQVVMGIWSLILYLNGLAEVQQFSIGKAIFNIIFAVLIILAGFLFLFYVLVLIVPTFFQRITLG